MIKNILQEWISHQKNKSSTHKSRVGMTFGTFDLFHPGHLHYLCEAKKLGEYLVTVVARDSTVMQVKSKLPRESEQKRLKNVSECEYVDEAILGSETDHYAVILDKKPDILCFGYDQRSFNDHRLHDFLRANNLSPKIVIIPAFEPEKWKSSKIILEGKSSKY